MYVCMVRLLCVPLPTPTGPDEDASAQHCGRRERSIYGDEAVGRRYMRCQGLAPLATGTRWTREDHATIVPVKRPQDPTQRGNETSPQSLQGKRNVAYIDHLLQRTAMQVVDWNILCMATPYTGTRGYYGCTAPMIEWILWLYGNSN